MNAILNVGILVSTFLPFAAMKGGNANPAKQTQITLGVGDNAYAEEPKLAWWSGYADTLHV
jgi:hypothetical protein